MSTARTSIGAVVRELGRVKASFYREDRFALQRKWIIRAVGLDVILTLLFILLAGARTLEVEAWYKEGFPSNLIVVQNQGSALKDVHVVVDGKYRTHLRVLEKGPTGLEIEHLRDDLDFAAPANYRPRAIEIRSGRAERRLELQPGHR